jgi:hypothetical protein
MESITIQPSKRLLIWQRIIFLVLPLSILNSALFVILFLILEPEHWFWGLFVGLVSFMGGIAGMFAGLSREMEHFSIYISGAAITGPSTGWYRKCSISVKEIERKRTAHSMAGKFNWKPKNIWSMYGDRIVVLNSIYPPGQRAILSERLETMQDKSRAEAEGKGPVVLTSTGRLARPIVFQPSQMRMIVTHIVFGLFGSLAGAVGVLLFSREIAQILWGAFGGFGGGIIGSLVLNSASRWKVTILKDTITGNPGQELLGSQKTSFFVARVDKARTAQADPVKVLLMSGRYIWSLEEDRIFLPDFFFPPEEVSRIFEHIGVAEKKE